MLGLDFINGLLASPVPSGGRLAAGIGITGPATLRDGGQPAAQHQFAGAMACDLRVFGELNLPDDPQGSIMECPVKEPCLPKCCYQDMWRSNLTCEASGTTAIIWKHQSGGGPAEDGRLNASERPLSRSVIENRSKVLTGRRQNGTRGGSSAASTDDGHINTRRATRRRSWRSQTIDKAGTPGGSSWLHSWSVLLHRAPGPNTGTLTCRQSGRSNHHVSNSTRQSGTRSWSCREARNQSCSNISG